MRVPALSLKGGCLCGTISEFVFPRQEPGAERADVAREGAGALKLRLEGVTEVG
jgi:hypothetical protein